MNEWRKINKNWWMCFLFDVYRECDCWHLCGATGRRINGEFKDADSAMRYANSLQD